ncbi:MAG: hypothetical protein R3F62_21195 [Planctomycetota bacterium]
MIQQNDDAQQQDATQRLAQAFGLDELPPGAQIVTVGLPGMQHDPREAAGSKKTSTYDYGGVVHKIRPAMKLFPGELEGRVALAIVTEYGDTIVAYFPRDRRPKVGTRVGLKGTWLSVDLELEDVLLRAEGCACCEALATLGEQHVDFQLDVESWQVVGPSFDFLLD